MLKIIASYQSHGQMSHLTFQPLMTRIRGVGEFGKVPTCDSRERSSTKRFYSTPDNAPSRVSARTIGLAFYKKTPPQTAVKKAQPKIYTAIQSVILNNPGDIPPLALAVPRHTTPLPTLHRHFHFTTDRIWCILDVYGVVEVLRKYHTGRHGQE